MSRLKEDDTLHQAVKLIFDMGQKTGEGDLPALLFSQQHCKDGECMICAEILCPHKDDLHFHHDGCPSCAEAEEVTPSVQIVEVDTVEAVVPAKQMIIPPKGLFEP